ncbi:TolC family protein [Marinicauda salina]|nr:TolC family protein [Marinicauda salina]
MTVRLLFALAAAFSFAAGAAASPPASLPPLEGVEAVIADAPAPAEARAGVDRARAAAARLRAGPYEFEVSAGASRRSIDGEGEFTEWTSGLNRGVRWPGKRRIDAELATLEVAIAEQAYRLAWRDTALEFARLLGEWRTAAGIAEMQARSAEDAEAAAEAQARRLANGAAREVDVEQLRADAGLAGLAAEQARLTADNAADALRAAFPGLELSALRDQAAGRAPPLPAAGDAVAVETMPEVRLALLARDRAALEARRARAEQRPDPQLGVQLFSERDGAETGLGVTVAVPISGRARSAAAAEAESRVTTLSVRLRSAERQARRRYSEAIREAQSAARSLAMAEASASAARSALARMRRGRDMGAVTVSELIRAREAARTAERALIEQQARAAAARLRLAIIEGRALQPTGPE